MIQDYFHDILPVFIAKPFTLINSITIYLHDAVFGILGLILQLILLTFEICLNGGYDSNHAFIL